MSIKAIRHGRFVIERVYDARPKEVFSAWTDPRMKAHWFTGPENWFLVRRETDVRIGGHEILHGCFEEGAETRFVARYHDVVPHELLVFTYDMHLDQDHVSVSLVTVEFLPSFHQTRLRYAEHSVFLEEIESVEAREQGVASHLDRLAATFGLGGLER